MKELLQEIENLSIADRQVAIQKNVMDTTYSSMYLALIEELGEYVASLGYQDWKVVPRDEENMLVELADICIFAMNCEYYDEIKPKISPVVYDRKHLGFTPDLAFVDEVLSMINNKEFNTIPSFIVTNRPQVLTVIEGKQTLNVIRQAYGYKEGKYNKYWNGVQDNEVMMSLVRNGEPNVLKHLLEAAKVAQRS
jgi:hypothetical protein